MHPVHWAIAVSTGLFLGILACLEVGYRIGRRSSEQYPESSHEGIGVIEAAVFALLGLLLGFSFAGGTSRLDAKRQLIVEEANAIGTAYLPSSITPFALNSNLKVFDPLVPLVWRKGSEVCSGNLHREGLPLLLG